jgi:hypothetical protein
MNQSVGGQSADISRVVLAIFIKMVMLSAQKNAVL